MSEVIESTGDGRSEVATKPNAAGAPADAPPPAAGHPEPGHQATRPWRVFALLAVVQFMMVLDTSIVFVALPSIQTDIGFSQTGLAWVMDAYMLAFGGFMLIGGRGADIIGRRPLLIAGMTVFMIASLACGLSQEPWHLVASRAAQGLGAAIAAPAALTMVIDLFKEGPDRHKALGIFGGLGGLAGASGVLLGGLLTSIGWQWAFFINVPIILVALVIGLRILPPSPWRASGGVDVLGALASTGGLCLLLYGVLQGGSHGWTNTSTLLYFGAAVVVLGLFTLRQLTAAAPLIPRMLFGRLNVVLGNLANASTGALMFGTFFILTLHLQQVRGYSPLEAALAIAPISLAIFIGSQVTIRLFGRIGPVNALAGGLAVQALALVWWAAGFSSSANLATSFILPGVLWGLGMGAAIVAAFVVCTSGLHGPVQGAASGLVSTTLQVGGAIGVAVMSSVAYAHLSGGTGDPVEAAVSGQSLALWAGVIIAVLAVPLMLWLRRAWQPPAHHGH